MQQVSHKGSILLWAMMLSIIVVVSFIGVSVAIQKNLFNTGISNILLEEILAIERSFSTQENGVIAHKSYMVFDNNREKIFSLQKEEVLELSFSGTSNFSINVGVVNGGAIEYQYHMFPDSTAIFTQTSSGMLNYSQSFSGTLDPTNNRGILYLKNLGGYSKIFLQTDSNFTEPNRNYTAIKKIGNVDIVVVKGSVKNFEKFSFGINY